jgi:hypothetical protein
MNNLVSDVYNKKISSIKIGNGIYKIKFVKFIKDSSKLLKQQSVNGRPIGRTTIFPCYNKHIITLRKDIKKEHQSRILYHEISHAIFHEMMQLQLDKDKKNTFELFMNDDNVVDNLTYILTTLEGNSK